MYLSLEDVKLTNKNRTPYAVSNLGDQNLLEDIIMDCLEDNPKVEKLQLGKIIGDALTKSDKFLAKAFTVNPSQTKMVPKRIVLDVVDHIGNVYNLWIFLTQEPTAKKVEVLEVPECSIKDFYIGSECGSGIEAASLKEFLEYIISEVQQREDDGESSFYITIAD